MPDLPEPLTPPDCDLRDFQFMPIDIVRVFGSRFHAIASDSEWRAGVTLWLKSFHQVPAASIPDDDIELARLAELGRDVRQWRKLKEGALYGWIKCSDGRLYHPIVAEKVLDAWAKKEIYRERSKKANAKRWGKDNPEAEPKGGAASGDKQPDNAGTVHSETGKKDSESTPERSYKESLKDALSNPSASQGRVKGQGEEEVERPSVSSISDADLPATDPLPAFLPAVIDQPDDADIAFERWQSLRSRIRPNTRALTLTPPRRAKLVKRLKEIGGLAAWDRCMKSVEGSPLLRGDKTDWKAELDWLLEPKNLTKILEGNYDDDGQVHLSTGHQGGSRVPRSPINGILAAHSGRGAG